MIPLMLRVKFLLSSLLSLSSVSCMVISTIVLFNAVVFVTVKFIFVVIYSTLISVDVLQLLYGSFPSYVTVTVCVPPWFGIYSMFSSPSSFVIIFCLSPSMVMFNGWLDNLSPNWSFNMKFIVILSFTTGLVLFVVIVMFVLSLSWNLLCSIITVLSEFVYIVPWYWVVVSPSLSSITAVPSFIMAVPVIFAILAMK